MPRATTAHRISALQPAPRNSTRRAMAWRSSSTRSREKWFGATSEGLRAADGTGGSAWRTALTEASENLWFVIDRLAPMPVDALLRAGDELALGLRRLSPGVEAVTSLLEPSV